jgi:hypothetical protein
MEEGRNTRYYAGPSGHKIPWMKEYEPSQIQKETRRDAGNAFRRECYLAKVAIIGIWRDITERQTQY